MRSDEMLCSESMPKKPPWGYFMTPRRIRLGSYSCVVGSSALTSSWTRNRGSFVDSASNRALSDDPSVLGAAEGCADWVGALDGSDAVATRPRESEAKAAAKAGR